MTIGNGSGQVNFDRRAKMQTETSSRIAAPVDTGVSVGSHRFVASVVGGLVLMVLAAQVRFVIPGTDVPMTLQSFAMLLIGMAVPASRAAGAMVLYLICGGLGLPVFAGDGGLSGLTAGYLWGFALAAPLIGWIAAGPGASYARLFLAGMVGMVVLLACGVLWRTSRFGGDVNAALITGAAPFILKAVVESALAASVARKWNVRSRASRS